MPLTQDLYRLKEYRSANPQLSDMSDSDLATIVNRQTGELGDLHQSSALGRFIARGSNALGELGQSAESGVKSMFGESYPSRVAARATSMAVQSAPEYLINLLAAKKLPSSPLGATALGGLNFGLGYGRTAVETGDTKAALGAGVGNVASLLGALAGSKIAGGGFDETGKSLHPVRAALGGLAGALPGQALQIATSPGGFEEFTKDSANIPATLLSNLPYMAVDHAREVGETAKLIREKKVAETPSLDEFTDLTPAQAYIKLSKIPVSQMTEQQAATMRNLNRDLSNREQATAQRIQSQQYDPNYDTVPESQASILSQIDMLNKGKKPAVMIPKGTSMPNIPVWQQLFKEHTNDAGTFLYDERKTNPQAIDDALKTDTLGTILGYGTPSKPKVETGYTAVLRDAKGNEKMGVVLGDGNDSQVMGHLNSLREPGDTVRRELSQDVIEKRLVDRNKIKDYSLSYEPKAYTVNAPAQDLANAYESFFRDKYEINDSSMVQTPHWMQGNTLVNPPSDFVRYLNRRKITLNPTQNATTTGQITTGNRPEYQTGNSSGQTAETGGGNSTVAGAPSANANSPVNAGGTQTEIPLDYSVQQKEFFKNTVLENLNKSLTPTERKGARFQPDERGNIGSSGVLKALEQWAPKEMFEHYKSAGLENFLKGSSDKTKYDELQAQMKTLGADKFNTPEFQRAWAASEKIKNRNGGLPPSTSSVSNKVSVDELSDWIRNNTPTIEVKKLEPAKTGTYQQLTDQLQHQVESLGYTTDTDPHSGEISIFKGDHMFEGPDDPEYDKLPEEHKRLIEKYEEAYRNESGDLTGPQGDAATGRYGVEPIKVSEMDSPVDILVRAQTNLTNKAPHMTDEASNARVELYRGPHFGDSDRNVVASIRGYFKQLPTGERAFFPFEIQSDWGQARGKEDAMVKEYPASGPALRRISDHPLLKSYETLALKTAIKHALENGATKIVLPDAKTAMMTEKHDSYPKYELPANFKYTVDKANFAVKNRGFEFGHMERRGDDLVELSGNGNSIVSYPGRFHGDELLLTNNDLRTAITEAYGTKTIPQEAGMKQHYDASLPAIASRLTGDSGKMVDLGKFTNREPSSVFNGKDNITGRAYDITNLKPEVENLFSLYGINDQHDLTERLASQKTEIEKALAEGKQVSPEQFVEASLKGENMDNATIVNYLKNLSGNEGPIKLLDLIGKDGLLVKGVKAATETGVNAKLRGSDAIRTAAHEFSHGAMNKLQWGNPEAYTDNINFVNSLGTEGREAILKSIFDQVGIKDADTKYLSGQGFKPDDPRLQDKTAREFFAGLSEALAHSAYNDARINPTIAKTLSWMPVGVQRWLSNLSQQWTRFFGPQYPSARHYLQGDDLKNLNESYKRMLDFSFQNESAQGEALTRLKRLELLDPSTFIDRIGDPSAKDWQPAARYITNQSKDFKDYSLDYLKNSKIGQKVNDFYEDNFLSALYRTKINPETSDFFQELHHYRNKIKNYEHGYLGFLGQNKDGTLSQEQALKSYNDYISDLVSPYSKDRNPRLEKMSKIFAENQRIREGLLNPIDPETPAAGTVREDQLVSRDDMVNKFGLSEKDADFMQRLVKLPQLVAQQTLRHSQAVDTVNLSKLFFLQNKEQKIGDVKNKVAELTRTSNQAGSIIVERKFYENYINELKKNPDQNAVVLSQMEPKVFQLKQQEQQLRAVTESQIRQSFANDIPFDAKPGEDPFINQMTNVSFRLAEARAEQAYIMRDEGYAPMTRRGRFLVKVFKKTFDGKAMPDSTESLQGFKTKNEALDFIKKNGLDNTSSQLIDKETFAERSQLYTPYQLQSVRDKARSDLDTQIREYIDKLPESPQRDSVANALIDIRNQFRPLDQEIKEVISAKGDKFKERRWLTPGFNDLDFIPNIFEYTNYKTIVGQKALTRAEAELQTLRPEVQSNPTMLTRMRRELDYVLSHTDEAAGLRKLIFYSYLGGSVRHVIQNLLQVPLNGIPEMVQQGAGMHAYSHALKAGKLAHDYVETGTTGNKTFDVLLKQAEKDGVTIPNAIEFFAPESADLQNALDSISSYENGQTNIGEKAKYSATQLGKGLEKFMRSTAVAGEQVNRRVSFLMSLLESERTGVKDPRQMFNKANLFTDYVNFVGDKSNRPGFQVKLGKTWAHAPVLVATALQSFVLNHIGQLYSYGRLAMRGDKPSQAAFATGTLHLIAMAGAMGIPFAQNAEQMFESATGISLKEAIRRGIIHKANDWFDIQEKNGGRIADTVLSGFPKLAGVEASQSIGLGDPLFSYQADRTPSALDVMGPLGGLINKAGQAASAIKADPFEPSSWMNATRTVAPQALNYWFRLMDATMKGGYYDQQGAPVVEGLNGQSSLALAGGFTPTEVNNVREVQKLRKKIETKSTADYQDAVNQVAQHLFQFNRTQDNDSLLAANDAFAKYVQAQAGTQDRSAMVRSIAERVQELGTPSNSPVSLKNSSQFQEALSSYPGTAYPTAAKLPVLVGELKAAQLLGQSDVLQQKLSAAKSAVLTSALYDHLVQAGYEPALAALLSQGGMSAARRLTESGALRAPAR